MIERVIRIVLVGILSGLILSPAVVAAEWDHLHLVAPDTKAAAEWYAGYFGGEVTKAGPFDAVLFGDNVVKFVKGNADVQGTIGSVLDHIGFTVDDVTAKVAQMEADGVKIHEKTRAIPGKDLNIAFVEDPWGTKIELIDDKEVSGLHHIHLVSPDPEAMLGWYVKAFGGEITRFRGMEPLPAILYGDVWLIASHREGPLATLKDRSVAHIGFNFKDFTTALDNLESMETTFVSGPRPANKPAQAMIASPDGVTIEIFQAKN